MSERDFTLNLISHHIFGNPDDSLYTIRGVRSRAEEPMSFDEMDRIANDDPIWAWRGKSIQYYALLESSLCWLLSHCGDMDQRVADVLFYKNTSAAARNSILEKLLRKKFKSRYSLFWNSYLKSLRQLDIKRNEIVHWLSVCYSRRMIDGSHDIGVALVPPGFSAVNDETPTNKITDLKEFAKQCSVYVSLCRQFIYLTSPLLEGQFSHAWHDIFHKPLVYPLPEDHLIYGVALRP